MPRATFRTYLLAVLASAGLVVLSPISLLVVFLSGDSCCGENTTPTMVGVTVVIVGLACGLAGGIAHALEHPGKRPAYRVRVGWAIIAGPVALIHIVFVTALSIAAF